MAKDKLISVIIPTFNRANYIEEAVNSVLSQTYDAIELIIIDDGSTDNTRQLLSEYGDELRYYRQDNQGIAAARNRGVTHATGDYLAFLDSDDIWMKDKLQRQMAVLEQIPQISVVYGHAEQFISPELDEETKRRFTHLDGKRLPSPTACG
ncbi:MAG: glycosyltransferase family 2 protein, partial [Planctomycetes bacterium]|nr:glycosyltransferase family 2 protein [Planctomycetota bacterium]